MQLLFAALPLAMCAATGVLCHRMMRGPGCGHAESSPGESSPGEVALLRADLAQLRGDRSGTPSRPRS